MPKILVSINMYVNKLQKTFSRPSSCSKTRRIMKASFSPIMYLKQTSRKREKPRSKKIIMLSKKTFFYFWKLHHRVRIKNRGKTDQHKQGAKVKYLQ